MTTSIPTVDSVTGEGRVRSEYDVIARTPQFAELRKRYRGFAIPATVAFLAWYLLYVVMSMFAGDFMGTKVLGNINVALVFGLLQFLSTFAIAWLYSRYSTQHLDPLAHELQQDHEGVSR